MQNEKIKKDLIVYKGKGVPLELPENPKIISNTPMQSSKYIEVRHLVFLENGKEKTWDIARSHDSVAILLYDFVRDGFIFVRQFRVSVFLKNPRHGYVYELCAGLCDKEGKDVAQIAAEELEEECGYCIRSESLESISTFYSSVGMNGSLQHLFYAKVSDDDRTKSGGGSESENENIDIIFVPYELIDEFLDDDLCPKSQSLCYAIMWFKLNLKR